MSSATNLAFIIPNKATHTSMGNENLHQAKYCNRLSFEKHSAVPENRMQKKNQARKGQQQEIMVK